MTKYRVYYNKSTEYPFIWSFDEGDISTEKVVKDIFIRGNAAVQSHFQPDADNTKEPRAWFEVICGHHWVSNDMAFFR